MAKMFYSAAEAAQKLGTTEEGVKDLVKEGKLREFRDAGSVNYKVDEVDKMAGVKSSPPKGGSSAGPSPADSAGGSGAEIILEPADDDDSSIELAGGSDILSLEELDSSSAGTSAGTKAPGSQEKKKGDSVVASVGVNVFDDDIDEDVDPLAQTAVTDMAGLGLEGSGGGSGIMDLTRESDDTSLGQELLDEIYTDSDKPSAAEDTKAGLEAASEPDTVDEDDELAVESPVAVSPATSASAGAGAAVGDPAAAALTALMVVAVVVMWFAGLGGAALVRGVTPSLLQWAYDKLMIVAGGALGLAILGAAVTFFMAKRSKS